MHQIIMTKLLDGTTLRDTLAKGLKAQVKRLGYRPRLVIIQVGDLPASTKYIKRKRALGREIGVVVTHKQYPESVSEKALRADIQAYGADPEVHGIMVQLPIPRRLNTNRVLGAILPVKDVDGLTGESARRLMHREETYLPATTQGILTLLTHYKIKLKGQKVVMVGDSILVGRPTAIALLNQGATVTICHKNTRDLAQETKQADILIVATGSPLLIGKDHVSPGQVVLDVGTTIVGKNKVLGDVDFNAVKDIVGAITPVPGGVGPMTVLSLFQNLLKNLK